MSSDLPETDVSALMGGRLTLRQRRTGHRAGTDAILLAASVPSDARGLLIDAGAGVGTAGLAAGLHAPALELLLFDREAEAVALAQENLALNSLSIRGRAAAADLLQPGSRRAAGILDGSAAVVISNPPYLEESRSRRSPDEARARAHVLEGTDGLTLWLRACAALVAPGGELVLIHRADRLGDMLAALEGRLGGISVLPVHPREGADAIRVLVRGTKGSRAPLRLRPGLILHRPDGGFTPQAEAVHRGEAILEW